MLYLSVIFILFHFIFVFYSLPYFLSFRGSFLFLIFAYLFLFRSFSFRWLWFVGCVFYRSKETHFGLFMNKQVCFRLNDKWWRTKKKKDDFNVSFFFNFRFVVFSFIFEFAGLKILFYLLLYSSAFGLSWNRPNEFVPYFGISRDINTTTKYCVHNCTYDACKYFAW